MLATIAVAASMLGSGLVFTAPQPKVRDVEMHFRYTGEQLDRDPGKVYGALVAEARKSCVYDRRYAAPSDYDPACARNLVDTAVQQLNHAQFSEVHRIATRGGKKMTRLASR